MNGATRYAENSNIRRHGRTPAIVKPSRSSQGREIKQSAVVFHSVSLNEVGHKNNLSDPILNITEIKPDNQTPWRLCQTHANTGKTPRKSRSLSYPGKLSPSTPLQENSLRESLLICRVCEAGGKRKFNGKRYYAEEKYTRRNADNLNTLSKPPLAKETVSNTCYRDLESNRPINILGDSKHSRSRKQNSVVQTQSDTATHDCNSKASYFGDVAPNFIPHGESTGYVMKSSDKLPEKIAALALDDSNTKNTATKKKEITLRTKWTERNENDPPTSEELSEISISSSGLSLPTLQENGTHKIEIPKKTFTKRLSKVIEVDGINYMVTMEPPGSSSCRTGCRTPQEVEIKSVDSPLKLDGSIQSVNDSRNANGISDRIATADLHKIAPSITNQQLDAWYDQRSKKSKAMDVKHCGAKDIVDPIKLEALDHAALRLRQLVVTITRGSVLSKDILRQNLEYAICVLESSFLKSNSKLDPMVSSDYEMLDNLSGEAPVPPEIKSWLVETFSKRRVGMDKKKTHPERQRFRSVVKCVQAGMALNKLYRRPTSASSENTLPPEVEIHLKSIDKWTFDVLELERISTGNALKYVCYQLLTKYDLLNKFKIGVPVLFSYCNKLQRGYRKHNNRYHNPCHAADVAQTLNCLLKHSGLANWLSDLEVFSMIMAALVHDLEHTGTTNNFHIHTKSTLAILYNDKSVLENHHVSTAFRMLQGDGCDILKNLTKEDYQDCRSLMIEMVLATDMKQHFEQVKNIESALQCPEMLEKSKTMCLLIHAADINHPSKPWKLHKKWTEKLLYEFFEQGDLERELELPLSPLCDRHSARIAQSQIGFIDFVVQPTFSTLLQTLSEINGPAIRAIIAQNNNNDDLGSANNAMPNDILKLRFCDVLSSNAIMHEHKEITEKLETFKELCFACMSYNKSQWMKKDVIERERSLYGEEALEGVTIIEDPLPDIIQRDMQSSDLNLNSTENGRAESSSLNNVEASPT